ncbi:MAG: ABC transporter ATP-binding protein [Phycisphaerales bacterium]|nr:ABC transporter ATP-binding protein [Phycisphaerales bacterium]
MDDLMFQEQDLPKGIDVRLWRRIFGHARSYLGSMIGLGACGVGMAAMDTLMPLITGFMIDSIIQGGEGIMIWWGGYMGVIFISCFIAWRFITLAGRVSTGVAYDLRTKSFGRLQELSFSWFDVRPQGWVLSRLTSDCMKVSSLMPWFMLDLFWGTSFIGGIILAMFLLNWKLALAILCIMPLLVMTTAYFQRKILRSSRMMRRSNSLITSNFSESISGIRTTKTLVREEENLREFQTLSGEMHDWSLRNSLQSAVYLPMVVSIGSIGVGIALWRGGMDVQVGGLTLGMLIAFMQYAVNFFMPIQELARRFTDMQAAQAAAERVQDLLDTEPEIRDSEAVVELMRLAKMNDPASSVGSDGGSTHISSIEFRNVGFSYVEGEQVLHEFDLSIQAGESIALVGATGGGKSTIANLLCRFYEPTSGGVYIDDVEYRQRSLHWLRSNLGVVLQVPHLFSGTIRENIAYGLEGSTAHEVEAAARRVDAHEFITAMEEGYDTQVGEGGSLLSTGQRQLVSLARAVLSDPQIFVMDEATSSVDTETERQIQHGIEAVMQDRIAVIIAHRLSTVRNADRILLIDQGRIMEAGTHDELLAARGRYFQLYTRQFAAP